MHMEHYVIYNAITEQIKNLDEIAYALEETPASANSLVSRLDLVAQKIRELKFSL